MTSVRLPHRPLRVVHVAVGLDMGGLEKLLVEIARHTDRERSELRFVSLGTRGALGGEIEKCGWPVTALHEPEGLRPGLVLRLAKWFRRWRPDVVHTHDPKALIYGGPAARLACVPRLVQTWHCQDLGGSSRQRLLFRLVGHFPDYVVAVSDAAARLLTCAGIGASKVRRVWNGIDLERFAYTGPRADGPIVIVARLNPVKDVETLIKAVALLRQEDSECHLQVAGDGPCLPALRATAESLGVSDRVTFLGMVQDVPALLARSSMLVLSSVSEGISLTLLEAMACGLPVVATHVGGNPEVVADGVTGLLVPPADPATLARALLRVRRDPEAGRRLGLAGRARVERHFEIRGMVAQYEALYREDLRGRAKLGHQVAAAAL